MDDIKSLGVWWLARLYALLICVAFGLPKKILPLAFTSLAPFVCVFDTSWLIFRCCSLLPPAICSCSGCGVRYHGRFLRAPCAGRYSKHACSYGHVTLFVLSAAPGQPTRNLDIVDFVLLCYSFCFVFASAVVRCRSRTSLPACDQIYLGRASWLVTRAHGFHHVSSYILWSTHVFVAFTRL